MKRALCLIREPLVYRRNAFLSGLRAVGYTAVNELISPEKDDVLVIWNRYGSNAAVANKFESAGARVLVSENGYFGKTWLGDRWFALAIGQHSGGGVWNVGGSERWNSLDVALSPWHFGGNELVILAQRGIGSEEVRSPNAWAQLIHRKYGGRIREHPGKDEPEVTLEYDLRAAQAVMTWASSAALKALVLGVPVWYGYSKWIGAEASRPLSEFGGEPKRDDAARLSMFQKMIWAMWRLSEIEDGTAFKRLLE